SGVSSGDSTSARVVPSELIKSYRLMAYASGEKPVVRVEVLLGAGVQPRVERTDSIELTLLAVSSARHDMPKGSASSEGASPSFVSAKATEAAPAESTAFRTIQRVNLAQNGAQTEVTVTGSGHLAYHVMRLQNPDRLVLDFAKAHMRTARRHIASNLDPVREIRLAQFTPQVSRMVVDLREPAHYSVNAAGNVVTVSFDPAVPMGAVKDVPSAPVSNLSSAKSAAPILASPEALSADSTALPRTLTQPSAGLASPARGAEPQQQAVAAARAAASTASATASNPIPIRAGDSMAPVAAAASFSPVSGKEMAQPGAVKYTGDPISVNFKNVDLQDFFRLIHEISGLNVVVDPNVKGSLTIVLTDVPWDQALDIVLHNNDLDKQLDGNVLRIATKATLKKEADQERDLAKAQTEAANLVTETRVLSYAKADDMSKVLKTFLSPRGDILSDPRSNALIIRDIPSTLPTMDNLIRQLDRKSQQVVIEARVVAANRSFAREIGTQFGFGLLNTTNHNISTVGGDAGTSPIIRNFPPFPVPPILVGSGGAAPTSGSIPLNSNLGVGAPTSGIEYAFSSQNFALDMIITAAESRGVGKLISSPKIFTQNNQKGTVANGVKIPVQTIVNNTVSVQFVDAVLKLEVTPQITADGTIFMNVVVTNDQIDQAIPRVQGIPAIDTQSTDTNVTVDDGATVVIGGVDVSQQRTSIDQVPLFGSLPIIGNLFKHTTVSSQDQELYFFLTPRILPD